MARASPIDKIVLVEMTNVEGGLFRISFQDFFSSEFVLLMLMMLIQNCVG